MYDAVEVAKRRKFDKFEVIRKMMRDKEVS